MKNICVFASGTGSNFDAIYTSTLCDNTDYKISLLVSDKPESIVVSKAKKLGIDVFAFNPRNYTSKDEFELMIVTELQKRDVSLLVLAGYMRIIGKTLLEKYPKKIINIHPSLLPLYKGIDAVGQAMRDGATTTGVTVHYVDEGMDTGKVIKQVSLSIENLKTRSQIDREIHKIEHILYPMVINSILEDL